MYRSRDDFDSSDYADTTPTCGNCGVDMPTKDYTFYRTGVVFHRYRHGFCEECIEKGEAQVTSKSVITYHKARRDHVRKDGTVYITAGEWYIHRRDMGFYVGGRRWLHAYNQPLNVTTQRKDIPTKVAWLEADRAAKTAARKAKRAEAKAKTSRQLPLWA